MTAGESAVAAHPLPLAEGNFAFPRGQPHFSEAAEPPNVEQLTTDPRSTGNGPQPAAFCGFLSRKVTLATRGLAQKETLRTQPKLK